MTRIAFQSKVRDACVALLTSYKNAKVPNLEVYPGRPQTIVPPHGFVDRIDETINYTAGLRQRHPVAQIVVIWGLFDSKNAAEQRDALVDGFLDTVTDNAAQANAATLIELNQISDEPVFVPDWGSDQQKNTAYYATRFFVEGLALEGD